MIIIGSRQQIVHFSDTTLTSGVRAMSHIVEVWRMLRTQFREHWAELSNRCAWCRSLREQCGRALGWSSLQGNDPHHHGAPNTNCPKIENLRSRIDSTAPGCLFLNSRAAHMSPRPLPYQEFWFSSVVICAPRLLGTAVRHDQRSMDESKA